MRRNKAKYNFAERAYRATQVKANHTQAKIEDMLEELGISDIRFTKHGSDYSIEFLVKLQRDESPRKVRIDAPIDTELGESGDSIERKKDIIFRTLLWHLKGRFVAVAKGLREFEEEFLADLVVVTNGKEQRLGDMIVPRYKEQLKHSKIAILNISN